MLTDASLSLTAFLKRYSFLNHPCDRSEVAHQVSQLRRRVTSLQDQLNVLNGQAYHS